MANVYFMNAQSGMQNAELSVMLNSSTTHVVQGFKQDPRNAIVMLGLAANKGKDVLGTNDFNQIVVTTLHNSAQVKWEVSMTGISPSIDIQFLLFSNYLSVRQGDTTKGFVTTAL